MRNICKYCIATFNTYRNFVEQKALWNFTIWNFLNQYPSYVSNEKCNVQPTRRRCRRVWFFFFQNRYHPSLSPITPKSKYERQKHSTSKKGGVAANITSKTTTLVKRCMHTYMYIVSSIKMFVSRDVYTNCYMCLWC